ncbi:MAG: phospholipid/cholesterol/gamma-HCH transport system substrate-binding protein [Solirubrobacteraceae bacterium]|nr:phospholipid/cholesterol/gamma-HCH transport system substrate-binding protein [Solirubrobacteraceae bacterium]
MQKQAPSVTRILTMVLFALSCFGLLLFLWLSFGGSVPLKAQGYRFKVSFPEATQLALQADVRVAGVSVGKVVNKTLDSQGNRTIATIEIKPQYAPIHKDAQAILRQKTLLGETYVELTPGTRGTKQHPNDLAEGGLLARTNVKPTVELDEIFQALDPRTRNAFQVWQQSLAQAVRGNDQNLNSALGNLPSFVSDATQLTRVLDVQHVALRKLVSNTGVVFNALARNQGQLRALIVNSANVFGETASKARELAETFQIFPTFLDESKITLARLRTFALDTDPLIRDLRPVAHDLVPTVHAVRLLAPDLRSFFIHLDSLIRVSRTGLPALRDILRGAKPLLAQLGPFLEQLNPILVYLEQNQHRVADFLSEGATGLAAKTDSLNPTGLKCPDKPGVCGHYLRQFGPVGPESLGLYGARDAGNRGNAYLPPLGLTGGRGGEFQMFPQWDCNPSGGETHPVQGMNGHPGCFIGRPHYSMFPQTSSSIPKIVQFHYKPGPR